MKSLALPDGTVTVSGAAGAVRFRSLVAGIGWPDRDPGYVCVVGERADRDYHALTEHRGGLWELASAAADMVSSLPLDRIVIDPTDELSASYLRNHEGLCGPIRPANLTSRRWSSTRRRNEMVHARPSFPIVHGVHERALTHFRAALEHTRGVVMSGRLLVHEVNCPMLVYTLRQPLDDLIQSPVMKALVWVVTELERSRGSDWEAPVAGTSWYSNLRREQ